MPHSWWLSTFRLCRHPHRHPHFHPLQITARTLSCRRPVKIDNALARAPERGSIAGKRLDSISQLFVPIYVPRDAIAPMGIHDVAAMAQAQAQAIQRTAVTPAAEVKDAQRVEAGRPATKGGGSPSAGCGCTCRVDEPTAAQKPPRKKERGGSVTFGNVIAAPLIAPAEGSSHSPHAPSEDSIEARLNAMRGAGRAEAEASSVAASAAAKSGLGRGNDGPSGTNAQSDESLEGSAEIAVSSPPPSPPTTLRVAAEAVAEAEAQGRLPGDTVLEVEAVTTANTEVGARGGLANLTSTRSVAPGLQKQRSESCNPTFDQQSTSTFAAVASRPPGQRRPRTLLRRTSIGSAKALGSAKNLFRQSFELSNS